MAKAAGGFNKNKAENIASDLSCSISMANNSLKNLKIAMERLQEGDGEVSYWSGERAVDWIKEAIVQFQNDQELIEHNTNCWEYLMVLIKKGRSL